MTAEKLCANKALRQPPRMSACFSVGGVPLHPHRAHPCSSTVPFPSPPRHAEVTCQRSRTKPICCMSVLYVGTRTIMRRVCSIDQILPGLSIASHPSGITARHMSQPLVGISDMPDQSFALADLFCPIFERNGMAE